MDVPRHLRGGLRRLGVSDSLDRNRRITYRTKDRNAPEEVAETRGERPPVCSRFGQPHPLDCSDIWCILVWRIRIFRDILTEAVVKSPYKSAIPRHFSTIAARYNELRITDPEPVDLMYRSLADMPEVTAADVGCGTGRYMIELMSLLGDKIFVYFIDCSEPMLERLRADLALRGLSRFDILVSRAERLPLPDENLECMLAFNAIHHFDPPGFLTEARRTIRPGGLLFIYTRFRDQNTRGIWGQHFPGFLEKERRLFDELELVEIIDSTPDLAVRYIRRFSFRRVATPAHCIERVRSRHYSTFCFYETDELEKAIAEFEVNLREEFGARGTLEWVDENVMITVERI